MVTKSLVKVKVPPPTGVDLILKVIVIGFAELPRSTTVQGYVHPAYKKMSEFVPVVVPALVIIEISTISLVVR